MWKYFAIIKDAFREALASRVLWFVLALITLLLLALAPFSYREELTWQLGDNDVREWPDLMVLVREARDAEQPSPERQLWILLDEDLQKRLANARIPGKDPDAANPFEFISVFRDFRRAVNELLEGRELYDPEAFAKVNLSSGELRALRDEGLDQLQGLELARFNRLLLEAALPDLIRSSPPTSLQFEYGWMDFGAAYPLRGVTLREFLQTTALTGTNWFLGVVGIFVAILVTAPMIPQTFAAGSLHLLLSKPISRSLLFLAKYFGGWMFIAISAVYLIGGLWLILGMRFGVWESKLLLSIPIYLFIFAIYYSVASLVGVIWRSAIVSIALTILFWVTCFSVGAAKATFETTIWNKARIAQLLQAGEAVLAVNEMGIVQQWAEAEREWEEIFVTPDQRQARAVLYLMPTVPQEIRPIGPLYDPARERLVSIQPTFPPTGLQLYTGPRADDWEAGPGVAAPAGVLGLFHEADGRLLVVTRAGFYRLRGDPIARQEPLTLFGFEIPLSFGGPFDRLGLEPPLLITQPAAINLDPIEGLLAVYSRGSLTILRRREGEYESADALKLDAQEREPAVLAAAAGRVILGREDGRLQVYRSEPLALEEELRPEGRNQPRFLVPSSDGKWIAIVFHNGALWLYDVPGNRLHRPDIRGQGDISAIAFPSSDETLVADRNVRVSRYRLPDWELVERYSPQLGLLEAVYRYGLRPLYTLFPKPGELDKTIQYLLSGRETERFDRDDLASAQREIDAWTPVWSSGLFTLVILILACLYLEWQDF